MKQLRIATNYTAMILYCFALGLDNFVSLPHRCQKIGFSIWNGDTV